MMCVLLQSGGDNTIDKTNTVDTQCQLTSAPLHDTVLAWPSDRVHVPTIEFIAPSMASALACTKKPAKSLFKPTRVTVCTEISINVQVTLNK